MNTGSIITLNLRGKKFFTTETTLKSRPNNIANMVNAQEAEYSLQDEFFIDRDPQVFHLILNYLADGRVIFADDNLTKALLYQEAKAYGLDGLVEKIALSNLNPSGYCDIKA